MPKTIHVLEYLKTHSLQQLKEEFGVNSSAKPGDYIFSLNYDQISSKPGSLVNQCRGLVISLNYNSSPLDEEQIKGKKPLGELIEVICNPIERFFNHGDSNAANITVENKDTIIWDKLDGTAIFLYQNPYTFDWCIATRSVPLADKPITGWEDFTFAKLFKKALVDTLISSNNIMLEATSELVFETWIKNLDPNYTYIFELTTPLNKVVVQYPDFKIHLLAIKHTKEGFEEEILNYKETGFYGVLICPNYNFNTSEELINFINSKSPFELEGVVLRDKNFNRVKWKSLPYTAYNRVRDSTANSPRAIMELILAEKLDDVMPVLETYIQNKAIKMQEGIRILFKNIDQKYLEAKEKIDHDIETLQVNYAFSGCIPKINERREFALEVQKSNTWMGPLMDRFSGKCKDTNDYIQQRRNPSDGSWPDSILDTLISQIEKLNLYK